VVSGVAEAALLVCAWLRSTGCRVRTGEALVLADFEAGVLDLAADTRRRPAVEPSTMTVTPESARVRSSFLACGGVTPAASIACVISAEVIAPLRVAACEINESARERMSVPGWRAAVTNDLPVAMSESDVLRQTSRTTRPQLCGRIFVSPVRRDSGVGFVTCGQA